MLADGGLYRWVKNGGSAFADAPAWLINLALPSLPPVEIFLEGKPLKSWVALELVDVDEVSS